MTIQEVMLRIEIPEEVRKNIGKYSLSEKEFYEWKHLFENDFEIFLNKWRETQKTFSMGFMVLSESWHVKSMKSIRRKIREEIFHVRFLISRFGVKNVIGIQSIWTGRSGMGCKVYSNGVVPSGKTSV